MRKPFSRLSDFIKDISFDAVHSLDYWRHNLRGNKIRKNFISGKSPHHPIILVQGFMGTRSVLIPLENHLRDHGFDVISLNLGFFNVGDIRESASILSAKIERLMNRYHLKKVHIIGHSMGGLIALYYVKCLGGHRVVDNLMTLGAPFEGTWSTYLGAIPFGLLSKGLWQMIPGSKFLKSLQGHPEEAHQTRVVSIAAKYDTICPPKSCHLAWARNEIVPVGHASLLMDQRVFELISEQLIQDRPGKRKVVPLRSNRD